MSKDYEEMTREERSEAMTHLRRQSDYYRNHPYIEDGGEADRIADQIEALQGVIDSYEECPIHGQQKIVGHGVCGGSVDPYDTDKLACGHEVASFGPGEPMMVVR